MLGRYQGRNGAIEIVECSADGTRIYFEEGVRQSQATPDGESVFSYVRLMDELLHRATNILVLGCGGGNLATRLARLGKDLTIVDNNPISFVIAQRYFGLPDGLPLVVSDFRKFILDDDLLYDGIAIDVGGPDFCFDDEFDVETSRNWPGSKASTRKPPTSCRAGRENIWNSSRPSWKTSARNSVWMML